MPKYYETHCHVFNKNVLSKRIVNLILPLAKIASDKESPFDNEKIKKAIDSLNTALNAATKETTEEVFKILASDYSKDFCFVPLMIDLTYADHNEGKRNLAHRLRRAGFISIIKTIVGILKLRAKRDPETSKKLDELFTSTNNKKGLINSILNLSEKVINDNSYIQQIIDLENLADKHKNVKPFFGVDPRRWYIGREDVLQKIKQKISLPDSKFHGIKLYAPNGFSPTDPVLYGTDNDHNGVYKYCEENKIPITVHCSNAGFACMSEIIKVNGHININGLIRKYNYEDYKFYRKFYSININKAIEERAQVLNHPKLWKLVLERFPNLYINFAHFGGSSQIMEYVNYKIPYESISNEEYIHICNNIDDDYRIFFERCFTKKRRTYVLKQGLSYDETKKLWNTLYYSGLIDNWSKAIFDIVRNPKYPNAYTDLSCFSDGVIINGSHIIQESLKNFKTFFFDKLTDYEKGKIIYGSDFFLVLFFGPNLSSYIKQFKEAFGKDFEIIAGKNPKNFLFGK